MSEPVAIDAFCCAGGVSRGLTDAGFRVIGIDHKRHKFYPYEFIEADLSAPKTLLDLIRRIRPAFVASSPPCQFISTATPKHSKAKHPNLIPATRIALVESGVPGWIENVETVGKHFTGYWIMLCGIMFPERTYHLRRHRRFELHNWRIRQPWHDGLACLRGIEGHACEKSICGEAARRAVICPNKQATCDRGSGRGGQLRKTMGVYGLVDAPESERARRDIESVHEGSNARAARQRRLAVAAVVAVAGNGPPDAEQSASYKRAREVFSVSGDNGNRGRGPRKVYAAGGGFKEVQGVGRRSTLTLLSRAGAGDGVGQSPGQNRPGPECIRWREAMDWLDGPKDRYGLSQAIPPAYAEWLATRFLETRRSHAR